MTALISNLKPTGVNTGDETAASIKAKLGITTLSGSNTGDQTDISGNAGTATALQTARNINGVPFSGLQDITINAVDSTPRLEAALLDQPNGVCPLDASRLVPANRLPSFVDDVLEFANLAAFPGTGETSKIYVALDTNKTYRWGGSSYTFITSGAVDSVAGKTGVVVLVKGDVGLSDVDNTADSAKPVSTAQAAADAAVQNAAATDATTKANAAQAAAAADATTKANAAQAAAIAASTPAAHAGAGGSAHANAVSGGAAGFMTGADKAKLDALTGWLAPTAVKTANYTAVAGDLVRVDSTAAAFTVTLPATPADGDRVALLDVTNKCGTNAVLIAAAGSKTVEFDATGLSANINGASVVLVYTNANSNWKML